MHWRADRALARAPELPARPTRTGQGQGIGYSTIQCRGLQPTRPLVAADRSWRIPQSGVRTKEGWLSIFGRKGRSSLGHQPERLKYLSRPLPRLALPLLFLTLEGFFNPSLRRESPPKLLILFSLSTHIPRSTSYSPRLDDFTTFQRLRHIPHHTYSVIKTIPYRRVPRKPY